MNKDQDSYLHFSRIERVRANDTDEIIGSSHLWTIKNPTVLPKAKDMVRNAGSGPYYRIAHIIHDFYPERQSAEDPKSVHPAETHTYCYIFETDLGTKYQGGEPTTKEA